MCIYIYIYIHHIFFIHSSVNRYLGCFRVLIIANSAAMNGASQVVLVVKNPPANAGDTGDLSLIPGLRRSPGGGHGDSLQSSCLENAMDRGAWHTIVYRVTKGLKWHSRHAHCYEHWDTCVFFSMVFSGYMHKSKFVESYGIFIPSFWRNLFPVLHSGYINLHS